MIGDLDAKTRNAIIGGLRRVFHRHPTRLAALNKQRVEEIAYNQDGSPSKRKSVFFICEHCGGKAKQGKSKSWPTAQVDHTDAVVPLDKAIADMSFDEYVGRLFCDVSNLKVLCHVCHEAKTSSERKLRRGK